MATSSCTLQTLTPWLHRFSRRHLDLGTGDGKFAAALAKTSPDLAVLGLDTCLDHLRLPARKQPVNLAFIPASAQAFLAPIGLTMAAISINFPYGSLLRSLVEADPALLETLRSWLGPAGQLDIRVNAQALVGTGLCRDDAEQAILRALATLPGLKLTSRPLSQTELRTFPSSWAKRLGFGKPTTAWHIQAT